MWSMAGTDGIAIYMVMSDITVDFYHTKFSILPTRRGGTYVSYSIKGVVQLYCLLVNAKQYVIN